MATARFLVVQPAPGPAAGRDRGRPRDGLRLSLYRSLLLLLLLHLVLTHQRHLTLLGLLGPLVVAPALAIRGSQVTPRKSGRGRSLVFAAVGWVGVTGLAVALGHDPKPAPRWIPEAALAAAREAGAQLDGVIENDTARLGG